MSSKRKTVVLRKDLQDLAEECVGTGKNISIAEVVFEALEEKQHARIDKALDEAFVAIEAGRSKRTTIKDFMADIDAATGLIP